MPFRKDYSAKEQVVLIGPQLSVPLPLVDLADSDDAIKAMVRNDKVEDPDMDLYGKGRFIVSSDDSGRIELEIKHSSIADLARMQVYQENNIPLQCIVKDLTTNLAGAISQDCRIAGPPEYKRGKRPGNSLYVLKCVDLAIRHDGPKLTPV